MENLTDLPVLFWDDTCVVLLKPAGLHAVPGLGPEKWDSVLTRLRQVDPHIQAVHRLDRDTSGLMVFSRCVAATRHLGIQFQQRTIDKRYRAWVSPAALADTGTLTLSMSYDPVNKPRQKVDAEHGKSSTTHWQVLQRTPQYQDVLLEPVTGRTHQLRLHCQQLGCPILGDALYADERTRGMTDRLCLHASALSFNHPVSGERLSFQQEPTFCLSPTAFG